MDNSSVVAKEGNQVDGEKPPPRVCPRCTSKNTKFYYYNNGSVSQPRYLCKNCRRYWTHGGALRNISIGGSSLKAKRTRRRFVSLVVVVSIKRVSDHQPFFHAQETNEFREYFDGYASSTDILENRYGSLPEINDDMVTNAALLRSFRPMEVLDFSEGFSS